MLRSNFIRKAHANFQNYFSLYAMCFSGKLTPNRRQFHVKLNSILNQIFILVSIDVFNHFNATNIKKKIILGV